jgi:PTH2 family peptidyl-tRNA hydrolase
MKNDRIKQVIVMRKDLGMRRGKQIAQGAHASFGVFRNMMKSKSKGGGVYEYSFEVGENIKSWLDGEFTKICVTVNSEKELLETYQAAKDAGLPTCLITDAGHTEFKGVPTKTCCAIGPAKETKINKITGNLKLF